MTNPDKIKNVLSNHEERCMDCWFHGVSGCNRLARSCKLFDAVQGALDYINELEPKALKWVSVKNRLPDKEPMLCLVVSNGNLCVSHWHWSDDGTWFFTDGEYDCNVKYWAEIPELPKEENYDELS